MVKNIGRLFIFAMFTVSVFVSLTTSKVVFAGDDGDWTISGNNMFSNVTGNIGIGTTTPDYQLEVKTPVNEYGIIQSAGTHKAGLYVGTTGGYMGTVTEDDFHLYTSGAGPVLTVTAGGTADGHVGIGTTEPNYPLEVKTPVDAFGIIQSDGTHKAGLYVGTTGGYIGTVSEHDFHVYTSSAGPVLTVTAGGTADGHVGIGTTSPNYQLHVNESTSEANYLQLTNSATGLTSADGVLFGMAANENTVIWNYEANRDIQFGTNTLEKMRILSNGNVGIGTTSPGEKLSVNGTIKAKEIIVDTSGWSDFVFNKDYDLMPLGKLEDYITSNKHLPEIPSADEVCEKGVKVGDMQARLLQKIEELTLYMIDMKKENEMMRGEREMLKKENELVKKRLAALEMGKM